MANRLKKLAEVRYTPGTPYVPGTPAYCVGRTEERTAVVFGGGGGGGGGGGTVTVVDTDGLTITYTPVRFPTYAPSVTTQEVCYPAVPAQPAVAPSTTYLALNAWNGGGRSIEPVVGDGGFRFEVSAAPSAVVVGLVLEDTGTQPGDASHAFYVHGTTVDVMEDGVVVATSPVAHSPATKLAISRTGGTVVYTHGGWTFTSAKLSTGAVYLDAAIYASGDFVDNPEILSAPVVLTGGFRGVLPRLEARLFDVANPTYADFTGRLPELFARLGGSTGGTGGFVGVLPPLSGRLADRSYAEFRGVLPALTGALDGGYPQVQMATFVGVLPPLTGWALGRTGEIGGFSGALPTLTGLLVDRTGYGEVRGALPALRGMLLSLPPDVPGTATADNTFLVTGDYLIGCGTPRAAIRDALAIDADFTLGVVIDGAVFDALALSATATAYRALTALIHSGLLLGSDNESRGQAQYAVNVLTSALTQYDGFDFQQFALADGRVYACRPDGVYQLRPGDDDGQPIGVRIDFGTTDYASIKAKHVDALFLGLTTDGDVLVTLRGDGADRVYRAVQRGPVMRVNPDKGRTARRWNLILEVADATHLQLDTLEQLVAVSTRRWTR